MDPPLWPEISCGSTLWPELSCGAPLWAEISCRCLIKNKAVNKTQMVVRLIKPLHVDLKNPSMDQSPTPRVHQPQGNLFTASFTLCALTCSTVYFCLWAFSWCWILVYVISESKTYPSLLWLFCSFMSYITIYLLDDRLLQ